MAYQAIVTTYYGPGNVRGARIRAKAQAGTMWFPYEYMGTDKMHDHAAEQYARHFGWRGNWYSGSLSGDSNVYVNAPFTEALPMIDERAAFNINLTDAEIEAAYKARKTVKPY